MARKSKEEEAKDGEAIDLATLPVGSVLRNYPLGQLVTLVATLLGSGAAGGYWVATITNAAELRQYRTEAEAQAKIAGTLQQAIAAGNCVKSRELMRQEAARAVVARIELARAAAAHVRKFGTIPSKQTHSVQLDLGLAQIPQVDLLLEDPDVRENINAVNVLLPRVNEAIQSIRALDLPSDFREPLSDLAKRDERGSGNPTIAKTVLGALDDFEATATVAREHLKAKYLSLDAAQP